ncbi:DUF6090 family protein [Winogradskyella aurantia]|nr:DUF6090 family protein [Winogradskyella aurantia]
MIKFFRKIRYDLIGKNKTGKPAHQTGRYLKYAVGEIILVVIGILIALSISDWNENRKNILSEKRYLNDLIQDLKNDAIMLNQINIFLESKSASKTKIEPLLDGHKVDIDSIDYHFTIQWAVRNRFTPTSITIEELKNSGKLNIIRDINLRRQIVSLYNTYSYEVFSEDMFNSANVKLVNLAGTYFRNVLEPTKDEIYVALEDNEFINGIRANFTFARMDAINDLRKRCSSLIQNLEKYKAEVHG